MRDCRKLLEGMVEFLAKSRDLTTNAGWVASSQPKEDRRTCLLTYVPGRLILISPRCHAICDYCNHYLDPCDGLASLEGLKR
jgi:2-iminoacetate synthase ThiH